MKLRDAGPFELWLRRVKVAGLTAHRFGRWLIEDGFAPPERVAPAGPIVHELRTPIARTGAHPRLEAGKRQNVKLAATAFHGAVVAPDRPLSFWRTLGPATAARGFTWGMELRAGCAIPAIGGGLCLISNALFALAVELGWQILERHGHSMALSDPQALDATVAYPHIDLRIAPRRGTAVLGVTVRGDVLVVAAHGGGERLRVELDREQREDGAGRDTRIRRRVWRERELLEEDVIVDDHQRLPGPSLRTCLDCGETACHARIELPAAAAAAAAGAGPPATAGGAVSAAGAGR
jgi:vancomycin resistance protein VanW